MNGTFVIGGPETLLVLGVHVKILSALFGVIGVALGHIMAPAAVEPLGWRRHSAVIDAAITKAGGTSDPALATTNAVLKTSAASLDEANDQNAQMLAALKEQNALLATLVANGNGSPSLLNLSQLASV